MSFNEKHPNFSLLRKVISENRFPIVFWIGAGVSADAHLPTWKSLRDILIKDSTEVLATLPLEEAEKQEVSLNEAEITENLWWAFGIIKEILGFPTYRALIRELLSPSDKVVVPELHKKIWEIEAVRGVITLNIDGLENSGHNLIRPSETIDVFLGKDIKNHMPTIQNRNPFIARLHGQHTDSSSWVFTEREINSLINSDAYRTCINSIFSHYKVIFLGISADDVAAGGFLSKLTQLGIDCGEHYWITNRVDSETNKWCRDSGVLSVPYTVSEGETHTSVISSLLDNIINYKSKDKESKAVVYFGEEIENIPDPKKLKFLDEDEIRYKLNAYAKHILYEGGGRTDTKIYHDFISKYSSSIHQSWHISTNEDSNTFFGYKILEKIYSGPFSNVWRVSGIENENYALKIIQVDNLSKGSQLSSFRRGVSSQKLLKDVGGFNGFAKIHKAFEIPTSVIMEFIEGENLEEISQKNNFDFWREGICILINICREVSKAHRSKYGVLHRDIRPNNIMLPNYYFGDDAIDLGLDVYEVKLLNYDLSWHKDAFGKVIPVDPTQMGYYAPEQLSESSNKLVRDSRVDSYGIGMTIFTLSTKSLPPISGSSDTVWDNCLSKIIKERKCWFSPAHNYLKRIINNSTNPKVNDRILVSDIEARLNNLYSAIFSDDSNANIENIAEKLIFNISNDRYEVDKTGCRFTYSYNINAQYCVYVNRENNKIIFHMYRQYEGLGDWNGISKKWISSLKSSKELLESGNWKVSEDSNYQNRTVELKSEINISVIRRNYKKSEESLSKAIKSFDMY